MNRQAKAAMIYATSIVDKSNPGREMHSDQQSIIANAQVPLATQSAPSLRDYALFRQEGMSGQLAPRACNARNELHTHVHWLRGISILGLGCITAEDQHPSAWSDLQREISANDALTRVSSGPFREK